MRTTMSSTLPADRSEATRAMLVALATDEAPVRRPLARPPARRVAVGSAFGVAVAVGATLLIGGPASSPAQAAWSAVPQPTPSSGVSGEEISRWRSTCSGHGIGGVARQGMPVRPGAAQDHKLLVDRRGDFTFCVDVSLGSGSRTVPLIAVVGLRADRGVEQGMSRSWAMMSPDPVSPPSGDDVLIFGGRSLPSTSLAKAHSVIETAEQMYGLVGPEVTRLDVVLANGLRVTATVRDGLWGVWWPLDKGDPAGSRLEVRTRDGVRPVDPETVRLDQPMLGTLRVPAGRPAISPSGSSRQR